MKKLVMILLMLALSVCLFSAGKPDPAKIRNYMLVFETTDYSSQLKDALNYFFKEVFQKGDQLIVFTPVRLYGYNPRKLTAPPKKLANDILKTLKSDISSGASRYRSTFKEMEIIAKELSEGSSNIEGVLQTYRENRNLLNQLTGNQEQKLMKYAGIFRAVKKGENHLVMFFQEKTRPIPDRKTMDGLRGNPKYGFKAAEILQGEMIKEEPNYDRVLAAFKYAGLKFHFLYLKQKGAKVRRGVQYVENSGDFYSTFSKICKASGGVTLTSSQPTKFLGKIERLFEGKVEVEVVNEEQK